MHQTADYWIDKLQLEPHPEGGWFTRLYQSDQLVSSDFMMDRPSLSSIYYLLESDDFSAFHRLNQDEQWHFYTGTALTIHMLSDDGIYSYEMLNADGLFQVTVPSGVYFGATVCKPDSFALVGCTVAPGFEYDDLEMPTRDDLLRRFPCHAALIQRLTRDKSRV